MAKFMTNLAGNIDRLQTDDGSVYAIEPQLSVEASQRATESADRCDALIAKVEPAETRRVEAEQARVAAERARADQQAKNNADQQANNAAAQGLQVVKLTNGQFTPSTGKPTIAGEVGKLYFVPDPKGGNDSLYSEWMYIDSKWEQVGMSTATLAGLTTGQIDSVVGGMQITSEAVMNGTILSYFWTKLKAKFAEATHKHQTADVTGLDKALGEKAAKAEVEALKGSALAYTEDSAVTDLNKLTTVGIYSVNNATNKPSGVSGWCNVIVIPINSGSSYTTQLLISTDGAAFSRAQKNGSWSSWKQL